MRHRSSVSWRHSVAFAWACVASMPAALAFAQSLDDPYFSNGAQVTSVPATGPAAAFFSNGAEATSVTADPSLSAYFTNGADVTSTNADPSLAPYFTKGADVTSTNADPSLAPYFTKGADATSVTADPSLAPYFSNGAQATSVPGPGQPGAEYFSNGGEATNVMLWPIGPTPKAPERATEVESSGAEQAAPESEDQEQERPREQGDGEQPQPENAEQPDPSAEATPAAPEKTAPEQAAPEQLEPQTEPALESDDDEDESSSLMVPGASDQPGTGSTTRRELPATRTSLQSPDRQFDGAQSDQASGLSKVIDMFTRGVSDYVSALAAMIAVLAMGLTWRMHRTRRRRREALA